MRNRLVQAFAPTFFAIPMLLVGASHAECPMDSWPASSVLQNIAQGIILDYSHADGTGCSDASTDIIKAACSKAKFATPLEFHREESLSPYPELTFDQFDSILAGKSVIYASTHGTYSSGLAALAVEYYPPSYPPEGTYAKDAHDRYLAYGVDPSYITYGPTPDSSAWIVAITADGIRALVAGEIDTRAIVHLEACKSIYLAPAWHEDVAMLGYEFSCSAPSACSETYTIWSRLGCYTAQYPTIAGAINSLNIQASGDLCRRLSQSITCETGGAFFPYVAAFPDPGGSGQTTVAFQTQSEERTASLTVRGYADTSDYPASPETLSTLSPSGGGWNHEDVLGQRLVRTRAL